MSEGECAVAGLDEITRAADCSSQRLVGGAVVGKDTVVGDVTRVVARAELACSADGERAGGDRGRSRVGVHASEGEVAGSTLGERAVSADDAAKRLVRAAGVVEGARVADVRRVVARTELPCPADGKRSGVDRRGS